VAAGDESGSSSGAGRWPDASAVVALLVEEAIAVISAEVYRWGPSAVMISSSSGGAPLDRERRCFAGSAVDLCGAGPPRTSPAAMAEATGSDIASANSFHASSSLCAAATATGSNCMSLSAAQGPPPAAQISWCAWSGVRALCVVNWVLLVAAEASLGENGWESCVD